MAITKKAAKKAVPKVVEEPKQIVLTQDQYDELVSFKWEINSISSQIESICTDEDKNQRQVAFDMGVLHVRTEKLYDDLGKITDDIELEFRYPVLADMVELETHESEIEKTFFFLKSCIQSITFGDDIHHRVDLKDKEIEDFIDQFTGEQFELITNFFNSMPKLRHTIEVTNPKTKVKSEVVLEGLESFLE